MLKIAQSFVVALSLVIGGALLQDAFGADVAFSWLPNSEADLAGYKIKSSATKGGPYTAVVDCKLPATGSDGMVKCTAPGVSTAPGYFVAVAYDAAGNESLPSVEVVVDLAPASPAYIKYNINGTATVSKDGAIKIEMVAAQQ